MQSFKNVQESTVLFLEKKKVNIFIHFPKSVRRVGVQANFQMKLVRLNDFDENSFFKLSFAYRKAEAERVAFRGSGKIRSQTK